MSKYVHGMTLLRSVDTAQNGMGLKGRHRHCISSLASGPVFPRWFILCQPQEATIIHEKLDVCLWVPIESVSFLSYCKQFQKEKLLWKTCSFLVIMPKYPTYTTFILIWVKIVLPWKVHAKLSALKTYTQITYTDRAGCTYEFRDNTHTCMLQ